MPAANLPEEVVLRPKWSGEAPDPSAHPALYRGLAWRRVLAYLVDVVLLIPIGLVCGSVFWLAGMLTFGLLMPIAAVAIAAVPFAYHTLLIGGARSATLGMRLFGVEMRLLDGSRPDYVHAGLITLLFYASVAMTGSLVLLMGLFNKRRRLLHDFLVGIVTVRSEALARA